MMTRSHLPIPTLKLLNNIVNRYRTYYYLYHSRNNNNNNNNNLFNGKNFQLQSYLWSNMIYINSNFDVSTIEELQKQNAPLVKAFKRKPVAV